jgi:hypothetical protein
MYSVTYTMRNESGPPIADKDQALEGDSAEGGGPSMANEDRHQIAARIAQQLRDGGFGCELLDPAPTVTAFGTLLRRDRIVVALALALLTAMTWSYLLWLSVDMGMGGMDMSGFRMVPSGMGRMSRRTSPGRSSYLYSPCGA